MKFSSFAVAALLAGFVFAGTASAQTAAPMPAKPAAAPTATTGSAVKPAGAPLTDEQAKKICDTRFPDKDKPKKHKACMTRHKKMIGKPINKYDAKTLATGK